MNRNRVGEPQGHKKVEVSQNVLSLLDNKELQPLS